MARYGAADSGAISKLSCVITLLSSLSLFVDWIPITSKALTKSTQTIVPTWREVVREAPLPVEGAVAGVLVLVVVLAVLLAVGALHSGTQISAVSVVVVETVSEVKCRIIPVISKLSVRVEVLEQVGQLVHVVVPQVRVVEGGAERAHVGGPGRHLAAVRSNAEHVDLGRGGDTWAG